MKVRLTYETIFEVTVDLDNGRVEDIGVLQEFPPITGADGHINAQAIDKPSDRLFTPADVKQAVWIIKRGEVPHPKWRLRRAVR